MSNPFERIIDEEVEEEGKNEDIVMNLSEEVEGFQNINSTISNIIEDKKILKSIALGLLFYLLANPRSFKYTNFLTNKLDKILVHSLIFTLLVYIILETV